MAITPVAAPPRVHRNSPNCFERYFSEDPGRRGGTSSRIQNSLAPLCPGLEGCTASRTGSRIAALGRKNRGFFILEMIAGIGLLAVAAFVLVLATSRVHLASSTMADSRQATRAAEARLSQLQAGLTPPEPAADTQVHITPISPAPEGGNWQWVDVTATVRGQTRTLTGRVPRNATHTAPAEGGGQ